MGVARALVSILLLCLIVTTLIEVIQHNMTLVQAFSYMLYFLGAFGVLMLVLDYLESRKGKRK